MSVLHELERAARYSTATTFPTHRKVPWHVEYCLQTLNRSSDLANHGIRAPTLIRDGFEFAEGSKKCHLFPPASKVCRRKIVEVDTCVSFGEGFLRYANVRKSNPSSR